MPLCSKDSASRFPDLLFACLTHECRAGAAALRCQRVVDLDQRTRSDDGRTLEDVLELAHVPGPVITQEAVHRLPRHSAQRLSVESRHVAHDVVCDERDVGHALAQGRQSQRKDVQTLIQIHPELACLGLPGKPWQNGADESFNGKFRDECLSLDQFWTRTEAKVVIETWRRHYNKVRPRQSLKDMTPFAFRARYDSTQGAVPQS